ncbi:HAD-IA family hydrolase, partial [Patescibacteria group bacterium]
GMLPLLLEKRLIPDIHYEQIVFSCDVGMMKPNSDIYVLAQTRAKVPSNKILLVDDREDYCESAKRAGWQIFLFDTKKRANSAKELEKYLSNSR